MPYSISKDFDFAASHHLNGLEEGHKCARLHGHNYLIRLEIRARRTNEVGFVLDYAKLDPFKRFLDAKLDHRDLNQVFTDPDFLYADFPEGDVPEAPVQPSAENMARWLTGIARALFDAQLPPGAVISVGVSETPKTFATWTEEPTLLRQSEEQ